MLNLEVVRWFTQFAVSHIKTFSFKAHSQKAIQGQLKTIYDNRKPFKNDEK